MVLGAGKNVLVTGGAGFLGSHVTDRAMAEGCNVYVMDNFYTGKEANLTHHMTNPRFHLVRGDVSAAFPASITAVKYDFIFHLACAASPVHYQADPIGTTLTCVNGTNHVLQLAQQSDCPVLIASTSEVYGNPEVHPQPESYHGSVNCTGIRSCYDEGKRCGEALAFDYNRKYGTKVRVARIFNTYGPRMCADDGRIVSNFVVQALTNRDITIYGTGAYTRSFQYVDDLLEGFWRLIQHPSEVGPVNLGNTGEFTVQAAAELVKKLIPTSESKIVYLPATQDDPQQRKPDITKAQAVLNGWTPKMAFEDGLKLTIEAFKTQITPATCDRVYVECNPLLDISAHVDEAFLAKYSLAVGAAGMATPEQMGIYGELEKLADCKLIPGGSGLNTARVAQWMSRAPKGRFITYVGSIADDAHGLTLKKSAESEGVNMAVQYSTKNCTGTCAVCIVGTERSLLANLAASADITLSHLETPVVRAAIEDAKLFYFTAFTLTLSKDYFITVAQRAKRHGGVMALNLSAPFLMQFFSEQMNAVLPYADVIFGNEHEAEALAAMLKIEGDHKDLKNVAKAAAALPKADGQPRLVILTAGKDATTYCFNGQIGEVPVSPIAQEKIIDTNGAGDAFVGGFLAAYARRLPVEQAILAGHYSAGVIIQHDGCTFPAVPEYTL